MRWPWWERRRPRAPVPGVNPRRQELETAKEILAEVFGARPSDVEEMIRLRLEERSWGEDGRWAERFCAGALCMSYVPLEPEITEGTQDINNHFDLAAERILKFYPYVFK
jgi:hypothetical protein